jgi:hypothetical protein
MPAKIPPNSTVASVWPHLAHPRQYVAGVRQKMMTCEKAHGNAHVRIGVTGTGQKPCYRVFHLNDKNTETVYGSYWENHDPLDNGDAVTLNWSTVSMSFAEIDAYLKEKINWKAP